MLNRTSFDMDNNLFILTMAPPASVIALTVKNYQIFGMHLRGVPNELITFYSCLRALVAERLFFQVITTVRDLALPSRVSTLVTKAARSLSNSSSISLVFSAERLFHSSILVSKALAVSKAI